MEQKFCECGCGEPVSGRTSAWKIKRFVHGHNGRVRPRTQKPYEYRDCACGCGAVIKRRYFQKEFPKSYVTGHQFKGKLNVHWNNGVTMANGYRYISKPDHPNSNKRGYVREHVFVMSEHLGRPIKKGEIVHHKNKRITDNRIENLEIMTNGEHTSLHHKGLIKPNSLKNLWFNHGEN